MSICRNNPSIFNFSSFSGCKVNLIGALEVSSFQKHREKQKKN